MRAAPTRSRMPRRTCASLQRAPRAGPAASPRDSRRCARKSEIGLRVRPARRRAARPAGTLTDERPRPDGAERKAHVARFPNDAAETDDRQVDAVPPREPAERAAGALGRQRKIDRLDELARRQHRSSGSGEEVIQRHLPRAARADEIHARAVREQRRRRVGGRRRVAEVAGERRAIANLHRSDRPAPLRPAQENARRSGVFSMTSVITGARADADASVDLARRRRAAPRRA